MIHTYLSEHQALYSRVLAADVRDTAFQDDPFAKVLGSLTEGQEALYVFEDDPQKTIGDCAWNAGWVKSCFGKQVRRPDFLHCIISTLEAITLKPRIHPTPKSHRLHAGAGPDLVQEDLLLGYQHGYNAGHVRLHGHH